MSNNKKNEETSLKGTLLATFGVGLVIILIWAGAFSEFISRF